MKEVKMSKVEERAYEVYPKMSRISEPHGLIPADNKSHYLGDGNEGKREGFIVGYHQAEKDLELTNADVYDIWRIYNEVCTEGKILGFDETSQEVLKRFKDYKQRKEK